MTRFGKDSFHVAGLGKFLAVIFGGAVFDFLIHSLKVDPDGAGQYAVGLLIGSAVYALAYWRVHGLPPARPTDGKPPKAS
jgi:hypothetical protein